MYGLQRLTYLNDVLVLHGAGGGSHVLAVPALFNCENALPVVLHADHCPANLLRFIVQSLGEGARPSCRAGLAPDRRRIYVAMRSLGSTNFALARSVVARTKSTITCFAGPSFQEDRGFAGTCARAAVGTNKLGNAGTVANVARSTRRLMLVAASLDFIFGSLQAQHEIASCRTSDS
jgi:hypothetical protein